MKDPLFNQSQNSEFGQSLAEKMRPRDWDEVVGQASAVRLLQKICERSTYPSLLFSGPPGVGKTSLARLLAHKSGAEFEFLSATDSGVKDLKALQERGRLLRLHYQKKLLVFIDEIHRFSRTQQDVLLPALESGDLWLVGATTENLRHALSSALLSRTQIVALTSLSREDLEILLKKCESFLNLKEAELLTPPAKEKLLQLCDGDGRRCLLMIEHLHTLRGNSAWDEESLSEALGEFWLRFDAQGDQHYQLSSALIKSIRGSQPDASLYYLARLVLGGERPEFLARRLMILASEDIGNADPKALPLAVAGAEACERVGWPEAELILAQVVTYLASCPKANSSYLAWKKAKEFVQKTGSLPVPNHLYSKSPDYLYPHDFPRHFIDQEYFPQALSRDKAGAPRFLNFSDLGFEKMLKAQLDWLHGRKDEGPQK